MAGIAFALVVATLATVGDAAVRWSQVEASQVFVHRVFARPIVPLGTDPSADEVARVQERLLELGYWLPAVSGTLDEGTTHAVTALQKAAGLDRDGHVGPEVLDLLRSGWRPSARSGDGRVVEIDLTRQVLFVVEDGDVRLTFDASSGTGETPTVTGSFRMGRQIDGMRVSIWGRLWRPKYFYRGQAIHGYPSVPTHPASHGCVRVTNAAIDHIWSQDLIPVGSLVQIYY